MHPIHPAVLIIAVIAAAVIAWFAAIPAGRRTNTACVRIAGIVCFPCDCGKTCARAAWGPWTARDNAGSAGRIA